MSDFFPNTSPLEAFRLVQALIGLSATAWALVHARDGSMAFAAPIRERMVTRRRWQVTGHLLIFLTLGIQTFAAALVPDPPVISSAGTAVSYVEIIVMGILLAMTFMFSVGWAGIQETLGRQPLVPTVIEASLESRLLLHDMRDDLAMIVGGIEILRIEGGLMPEQHDALARIATAADLLSQRLDSVQQLARSLSPDVPPSRRGTS